MHVFRSPILPRPLRLLCVVDSGSAFTSASAPPSLLLRCSFSSAAVSQSRSHRPTSSSSPRPAENASPVPEESEPSQVRDKGNGSVIGKGAVSSSNSNHRSSTIKGSRIGNWQSSLFDSLFPEDASGPIRRKPIGRLDISEDSTYLPDPMEGLARRKRMDNGNWAKSRAYGPQEKMSRYGKLELGRKKPRGRLTTAPSTRRISPSPIELPSQFFFLFFLFLSSELLPFFFFLFSSFPLWLQLRAPFISSASSSHFPPLEIIDMVFPGCFS
ncbi:hypothetical protein B9Z19DRAFT_497169 [Tuber borchii]|uniref:Uncharacterized protein n=1 Tax=Tuber borchii TaxID=42251 RepID=A0A2T6ZEH2_TUBBO|nr:hypothetical protein B9Z19DRAFT_497169 [Tuber borchii]